MAYRIIDSATINYKPTVYNTASYPGINTAGGSVNIINQITQNVLSGTTNALPTPDIKLVYGNLTEFQWFDKSTNSVGGNCTLDRRIFINPKDLSPDLIATGSVYIEMLHYRKQKKNYPFTESKGFMAPTAHYIDNSNDYPEWGNNFWVRSGVHNYVSGGTTIFMNINRPNHYKVTSDTMIDVTPYLNGRFIEKSVGYRNTTGGTSNFTTLVPYQMQRKSKKGASNRFAYGSIYSNLYIAFRYVLWNPTANGGRGQIYSGPISKTLKIGHKYKPFIDDYIANISVGKPTCYINPLHTITEFSVNVESNLP